MKSFDEFKKDEVQISREEFAQLSARVINAIVDGMKLHGKEDFKARALFTAFLAVIMDELFDSCDLDMEGEND